MEVLCVFSVYEINSMYLYCLYLDRNEILFFAANMNLLP